MLALLLEHSQRMAQLPPIFGEASALPRSYKWIEDQHPEFVTQFADVVHLLRYRSTLDFVICMIFPDLEPSCRVFYRNCTKPRLVDLVSAQTLKELDRTVLRISKTLLNKPPRL